MISKYRAMRHVIATYPHWPIHRVTEDCPIEANPEFENWRWLLDPDGELIFANGLDPAITIEQYLLCKGVIHESQQLS